MTHSTRNLLDRQIGYAALISAVAFLVAGGTPVAVGQQVSGTGWRPFPVFDATLYRSKPSLAVTGLLPIAGVYAGQFGETWYKDPAQLPPKSTVQEAAQAALGKASLAFLDIEHWPQKGTAATVADSVSKYVAVAQWFREAAPGLPFGYYGAPPVPDYWRAIAPSTGADYTSWISDNDRLRPIADTVDILFPSLYTFYDDRDGWRRQAIAQIAEARRYGAGKPVYVFLWPQYHDSNPSLAWAYLPADFWKLELDTARQYADGIVIWGGWSAAGTPVEWDEHASWWMITKAFLSDLRTSSRLPSKLTPPSLVVQ